MSDQARASDDGMPEIPDFLRRPRDTRKAHEILAAADAAIRSMHINTKPGAITMTKTTAAPGPKGEQIKALRTKAAEVAETQRQNAKANGGNAVAKSDGAGGSQATTAEGASASTETPKPTAAAEASKTKESTVKTSNAVKTKTTAPKAKPAPTKRKASSKSAATQNARKPVENGPRGMAIEIGKLASRPNGASRAELIELTGWKQQAWKWYFVNSKNNGFCQKFGYTLKVIEGKDGESRYKITKK